MILFAAGAGWYIGSNWAWFIQNGGGIVWAFILGGLVFAYKRGMFGVLGGGMGRV